MRDAATPRTISSHRAVESGHALAFSPTSISLRARTCRTRCGFWTVNSVTVLPKKSTRSCLTDGAGEISSAYDLQQRSANGLGARHSACSAIDTWCLYEYRVL